MEIIDIKSSQAEVPHLQNIVAFSIAEPGACGSAGDVIGITADGKTYRLNFMRGNWTPDTLRMVSPVIADARMGIFGQGDYSEGWTSVYLGLGNHLYVSDSYFERFKELVTAEQIRSKGELYQKWQSIVLSMLSEGEVSSPEERCADEQDYNPVNPDIEPNLDRMFKGGFSISDMLQTKG